MVLLTGFWDFKNGSRLAVSSQCALNTIFFFKVILFYLEISFAIIQCLKTVSTADICSDLICLQSQWFSADILWKFPGNGQRRRPYSVSCSFMKTSMSVFPFHWIWKLSFAIMFSFKFSLWLSPVLLKLEYFYL